MVPPDHRYDPFLDFLSQPDPFVGYCGSFLNKLLSQTKRKLDYFRQNTGRPSGETNRGENTPWNRVVHRARTADAHAAPARNALAIVATSACGVSERAGAAGSVVTVMAGAWASALAGEA